MRRREIESLWFCYLEKKFEFIDPRKIDRNSSGKSLFIQNFQLRASRSIFQETLILLREFSKRGYISLFTVLDLGFLDIMRRNWDKKGSFRT